VDIIEEKEKTEKNYYYLTVANYLTDLHAFAITKKCLDEIGLYDENFYPVYYDDTDYSYRMKLAGAKRDLCYPKRISQKLGGAVASDQELFDLYWKNVSHIHDYFTRKWGGEAGGEIFKTPFNDPDKSIKDWTIEKEEISYE
jgi:GT2 family glycosyltransferase